jgi:threonine dehydrogenase-like Zn-dependent dehydrogenase
MKTKAVRLYGKNDLRLEEFILPQIKDDEILARIVSDSICMSSYKAAIQGADHKRVPNDVDKNPIIIGHEFCGEIVSVGVKWQDKFKPGSKFSIQPALNLESNPYAAPGYTFQHIGGAATYIIIPNEVMESNCLLNYNGEAYFYGSLAEPMSCIVGAFHASYHTTGGSYVHSMGIVEGGNMAILAGVGPMGLGAIDYAIHCDRKPKLLVVTDIDDDRLKRAASIYTVEEAAKNGVTLKYVNTSKLENVPENLISFTDGKGYDDVFVFAPVKAVIEQGDKILGKDCFLIILFAWIKLRSVLTFLTDYTNVCQYRNIITLLKKYIKNYSIFFGFLIKSSLIGFISKQHIPYFYPVTFLFIPLCYNTAFYRLTLSGHYYRCCHTEPPPL